MATELINRPFTATWNGPEITTSWFNPVVVINTATADGVVDVKLPAATTDQPFGILLNRPAATGAAASIARIVDCNIVKVIANDTFTSGDFAGIGTVGDTTTSGKAVPASAISLPNTSTAFTATAYGYSFGRVLNRVAATGAVAIIETFLLKYAVSD